MISSKTPARRRGGNVSLVIALLFTASVVVRLLGGTAEAIAKEVAAIAPATHTDPEALRPSSAGQINSILDTLDQRSRKLDAKREELDLREKDIEILANVVKGQLEELTAAEKSLESLIALAQTAAEGDVANLTAMYENMKPKDAAAVFEEMAPQFAAGFLGRMRPEQAAQIFAGLQPSTAYSISVILAGRNVDVPTE